MSRRAGVRVQFAAEMHIVAAIAAGERPEWGCDDFWEGGAMDLSKLKGDTCVTVFAVPFTLCASAEAPEWLNSLLDAYDLAAEFETPLPGTLPDQAGADTAERLSFLCVSPLHVSPVCASLRLLVTYRWQGSGGSRTCEGSVASGTCSACSLQLVVRDAPCREVLSTRSTSSKITLNS